MKKMSFKLATVAGCVIAALSVSAQSTIHKGEDGELYTLPLHSQKESKLEQDLLKQMEQKKTVNVIVYFEGEGIQKELDAIDSRYKPQVSDLTERLNLIQTKYRAKESLSEKEEQEHIKSGAMAMNFVDQSMALNIKEELDTLLDSMKVEKGTLIEKSSASTLNAMSRMVSSLGGKVTNRIPLSRALGVTVAADAVKRLAEYPGVKAVYLDREADYELDVSVPSAKFNTWHNAGFDGYPYDFGVVDSGVRENHPAFSSAGIVFCSKSGSSVTGDHGTHVAGIVASNDSTHKGTAYGVDSVIWANSGGQSTTMSNMQWMITGSCQGPEVVNHSLGYGTANSSDYNDNDAFYDAFVQNYNVMVTKSAGNGYWNDSNPTITHPAPAYNLMAVANMDDKNTTSRSDDKRRSSSSVGPTVSNRKKPDITAPGTNIMSTNSDWATEADFISKSGTSMAAPHVAGAIILMEDGGNHTPMAQKAVLINTADAWDSKNTSSDSDDVQVSGSHWDKSYGWGYIDMWESHYNRSDYFVNSVIPRNNNATADDYKLFKGKMFTNEKATLVWQRRANFESGPSGSAHNLSDLNVRLYDEGNPATHDSDLDGNDNVHQVAAANTIDAVVKVYSWSSSFDGASSESFALATEENFSAATPPTLSMPSKTVNGTPFSPIKVSMTVSNSGDVDTCNVTVSRGIVAGVSGPTSVTLSPISDGGNGTATFSLSAPVGTYNIPFTARTTCYDETYTTTANVNLKSQIIILPPPIKLSR
ncbi:S8 family serine peptidase [Pleionea sp. CnH1-48]|uniref:S8 family serine peptidase n=1 Tax=Pleionea sp. CnH1-48 TaxID=2954494 RepID=UPI002096DFA7|nr:S8 family serine peptidase [Pleionea sp. CnH1-48]MCO7225097.1 S8 family serine peptidase [Pleionea sp. CnH1-48]